jgi:hypothetical protein
MCTIRSDLIAIAAILLAATSAADDSVADFDWLSGCWASEDQEAGSGEMWTTPAGGVLLGISRTVKEGRTVAYEFMQIRETAPGKISFIALPSGQSRTEFPLISTREFELVFENPAHDYPQRVIYRREASRLIGRIEGTVNGSLRSSDFVMHKVSCSERADS